MGTFTGKQYKGASRDLQATKRKEAEARFAKSSHEKDGRKARELLIKVFGIKVDD